MGRMTSHKYIYIYIMIMKWEISTMFETTNQTINHLILTWLSYLGDTLSHHGKLPAVTWLKPRSASSVKVQLRQVSHLWESHHTQRLLGKSTENAMNIWENHGKCQKIWDKSGTNIFILQVWSLVFLMGISWDSWDPGRDGKVKPYVRNSRGLEKSP